MGANAQALLMLVAMFRSQLAYTDSALVESIVLSPLHLDTDANSQQTESVLV